MLVVSTLLGLVRLVEWLDPPAPETCRIGTVIDGDSLTLTCGGVAFETRLLGIDTPELHGACAFEIEAAKAARSALRDLTRAPGTVQVLRQGKDRYGRTLVTLLLDGKDAAKTLISQGHGRRYDGGTRQGWCPAGGAPVPGDGVAPP